MGSELKDIRVEGIDAEVDSFATCIAAAIKYWGRGYEYDFVAGLSGTVFSPTWYESEDCMAWWTETGNGHRIKFLGKTLGFNIRESPVMFREEYDEKKELSRDLARFWDRAKGAVADNQVVLVKTWPAWSIITEWNDDFSQIGIATVENLKSLIKPDLLNRAYILTPGPAGFTRMEAIRAAIKFGADMADGTFKLKGFQYGGKIYEMILKRLDAEYFCGTCEQESCKCAVRTMTRIHGTNNDAYNFLTFAGEFMGRQVPKPALEAAIKGYGEIRDLSGAYLDRDVVCDNWEEMEFKTQFAKKVQAMRVAHKDLAKFLRRLSDEI